MFQQKGLHSVGKAKHQKDRERSDKIVFWRFLFNLVQTLRQNLHMSSSANLNRDFAALTNAPCHFPGGEDSAETLLLTVAIVVIGLWPLGVASVSGSRC